MGSSPSSEGVLIGSGGYFEDFQCHRFEVNQYLVAEVMPVLLKSGLSASREETVEKRNLGEKGGTPSEYSWNSFESRTRTLILESLGTMPSLGLFSELDSFELGLLETYENQHARAEILDLVIDNLDMREVLPVNSIPKNYNSASYLREYKSLLGHRNDTNQLVSDNTVHYGTVHSNIIHHGTVHLNTIHPASIDTVLPPSIDTVHPASIDTVYHASIDTVHPASTNTVHPDTVHPVKNDTNCGETEKNEVLILEVNENGMLKDEEGRTRNSA
ncbi:hypothetical protein F2Q69_00053321 [Brassica cretica]|uniref:Uncharacterized protein n=1 Tax=Brassica cretica TaxID=69181 RepID=A0A8S9MXJ6_BRACR|nr:hypothetical protein F2Q69_00053321 [Brassica cretica]